MNTWKFAFQREKISSLYGILKRIEVILLAREKTFNYLFCLCFKISFCWANNITQRVKMLAMEAWLSELDPRSWLMVGGENLIPKWFSDHHICALTHIPTRVCIHIRVHTYTPTEIISKVNLTFCDAGTVTQGLVDHMKCSTTGPFPWILTAYIKN